MSAAEQLLYEKRLPDFVGDGFRRIDPKVMTRRPPRIKWGELYKSWKPERKIEYLEKFAASMNNAADLLQHERNELNVLCEKKEKQIEAMKVAIDQNNAMIQSEITKMNAERQEYNKAIAERNQRIRELESM